MTAREKVQHIHRQSPASSPTQRGSNCRVQPENNNAMSKLLNPEKRQVRHYLQEYAVQAVYRLMITPSCYQYKRTSTFIPGVTSCSDVSTTPSSYPSKRLRQVNCSRSTLRRHCHKRSVLLPASTCKQLRSMSPSRSTATMHMLPQQLNTMHGSAA